VRARFSAMLCLLSVIGGATLWSPVARAVPSFARQTGQPCSTCHITSFGPALTPFGQHFKLNGYVWKKEDAPVLPIAAMQITSFTNTRKDQDGGAAPHFSPNNNVAADQTSLFYGGAIAGPVGAFVQVTYDGVARRLAWDNTDIRMAHTFAFGPIDIVGGVSLNNNPTVQDLWNSTPAWSYPYVSSALAPSPAAAPLLEGAFAQEVWGLTTYAMINDWVYLESGVYRTLPHRFQSQVGVGPSGEDTIDGYAPYWRAALSHSFGPAYLSAGIFGMHTRLRPGGDGTAGEDRYTDLGSDLSWQVDLAPGQLFEGNFTYLHELQHLPASVAMGAAGSASGELNTLRTHAGYVWQQTVSFSAGFFDIRGSSDSLRFSPDPIDGSASGTPNSRGFLYMLEYIPFGKRNSLWHPYLNVRLGLQYVAYNLFNGGKDNYDGSGRNAQDNNTLFVFVWSAI
jgi:hypothetical protein